MQITSMSPLIQWCQINCTLTVDKEDIGWVLLSYLEEYLPVLPTVRVITGEREHLQYMKKNNR